MHIRTLSRGNNLFLYDSFPESCYCQCSDAVMQWCVWRANPSLCRAFKQWHHIVLGRNQCPENLHVVNVNTLKKIQKHLKYLNIPLLLCIKQLSLVRFKIHFTGIYISWATLASISLEWVGDLTYVLVTKSKLPLQKIQYAIDLVSQGGQFPRLICSRYPVPKIIAIVIK